MEFDIVLSVRRSVKLTGVQGLPYDVPFTIPFFGYVVRHNKRPIHVLSNFRVLVSPPFSQPQLPHSHR